MRKEEKKAEGKVWVVSYFPLENYSYGDTVKVEGKLSIPEGILSDTANLLSATFLAIYQ